MKHVFTIKCEMEERWVPHFLSMLKYMQQLGGAGASRVVSLYVDGGGDFKPKFTWVGTLKDNVPPTEDKCGDRLYDAG